MALAPLIKSPVDTRDYLYKTTGKIINLPERVDLRVFDRDGIQDQKWSNSCVANATISCVEILMSRAGKFQDMSRLFHYWWIRRFHGRQNQDVGASPRVAMRVIRDMGICPESTWPFDLSNVNTQPPQYAEDEAKQLAGGEYCSVDGVAGSDEKLQNMKCALAEGYPIMIAAYMHNEFMGMQNIATLEETAQIISEKTNYRPAGVMPGHAMAIVGYWEHNGKPHFLIENSWSTNWGCGGYALAPIDWVSTWVDEFWLMLSIPGCVLPTIWTPQLEGQKPKPIKPVRPKEREVAPNGKKHTMVCTIKRWVQKCFGKKLTCGCGAEKK